MAHQMRPGAAADPVAQRPTEVILEPNETGNHLVMLAHPQCPCTRASLAELAKIMARSEGHLRASVYFYLPADQPEAWARTSSWQQAAAIPGVAVATDPEGRMAARFGAKTSGQVVLFDAAGHTLFSGGITGSRGHEGDNVGADAVVALARGEKPPETRSLVFGCALAGRPSSALSPL